jgi:hypothetical protein
MIYNCYFRNKAMFITETIPSPTAEVNILSSVANYTRNGQLRNKKIKEEQNILTESFFESPIGNYTDRATAACLRS